VKLNSSRNVLDCLPLLLGTISFILNEIDDEKFPFAFTRQAEKNNASENSEETYFSNLSGEDLIKNKFRDYITKILMAKTSHFLEKTKLEEIQEFIKNDLKRNSILKNFISFSEEEGSNSFYMRISEETHLKEIINILKFNYEKQLKLKHFDERIFLLENSFADCSTVKFTPLKRQKVSKEFVEIIPKGRNLFQVPETLDNKDFNICDMKKKFSFGEDALSHTNNFSIGKSDLSSNNNFNFTQGYVQRSHNQSSMIFGEHKGIDIKEFNKVY
jgi:hypothetical protein